MNAKVTAKRLLKHYLHMIAYKAGAYLDSDNDVEIEILVDALVEAAEQSALSKLSEINTISPVDTRHGG